MNQNKQPLAIIALGGNAILPATGSGTIEEQKSITRMTMEQVVRMIKSGYRIAMTHGNGPIVGNILIRNESARSIVPPMPLDVCGADSEGGIGYMMQQCLRNELDKKGMTQSCVTLITQVLVDRNDPAFQHPTKPIGPFYNSLEAEFMESEKGWDMIEDAGRGYRRVVASPEPLDIIEKDVIKKLVAEDVLVIAAGGGGVPVEKLPDGTLQGVEAVIDKDLVAGLMANLLKADELIIVTAVPQLAVNFNKPNQRFLDRISLAELEKLNREGQFPPGSMGPKMKAIQGFLRTGGKKAIITSPENLEESVLGKKGTVIFPN